MFQLTTPRQFVLLSLLEVLVATLVQSGCVSV
jgi:hypothetical protein